MEDEVGWARKKTPKVMVRHTASVILIFLFLWTIQAGIKLATDPGDEAKYYHFAFLIGVVTITFGTIYLIIGLGIIADLALGWSAQSQSKEEKKTVVHQAREMKTTPKDTIRIAATVITMFMLLWAIFTGFQLVATPTRRDRRYSALAFSIGVVAIVFGLVYFIIGLAILADLVLNISDELQKNDRKEYDIHIGGCVDV